MITDDAVAEFISMTAAQADEARGYLEMAGGDLQSAVNLFLEMGGGGGSAPAAPAARPLAPAAPSGGDIVDADVAAEVAAAAAAAGIDTDMMQDTHMEEEVRAPMPAYQDQIINPDHERRAVEAAMLADSESMSRRMTFDRGPDRPGAGAAGQDESDDIQMSDGQAINQLFAAPSYNEARSFRETVEKAKSEGKWLLVNIQQAEVFASHMLNRDVWSDETIKEIIDGSFLFWQRDDKSTEGEQFCQYYRCGHQLPHICVVDPRTGRNVKSWDGRKWSESHAAAEYLFGFLDRFSMSRSPPAGSPAATPAASPSLEPQPPPASGMDAKMELTGLDDAPRSGYTEPEAPKELAPALPEEPCDAVEHIKVSLKLPSGTRVTRRFLPGDPLEQMFIVAAALAEQPLRLVDLATQFPKRSLRDVEGGLSILVKDAQVAGNMILVSVRSA
eukprot:TRINITY_DN75098_c0_g1_i1.p1 TRINITY_DN75098_c0_g1~~TRINITY_DN75098_c0_g1_i1.p1  ORF type:complete len:444 (-),score=91.23 TRINITY_DN75098_c0_g1_i1:142-1473(-)